MNPNLTEEQRQTLLEAATIMLQAIGAVGDQGESLPERDSLSWKYPNISSAAHHAISLAISRNWNPS